MQDNPNETLQEFFARGTGKPRGRRTCVPPIDSPEIPPSKIGAPRLWTKAKLDELAPRLIEWFSIQDIQHIWLTRFLTEQGMVESQVHVYCERSSVFANAYRMCKQQQSTKLVELGLSAKYSASSTMAMFALKNVAGWRDKPPELTERENVQEIRWSTVQVTPTGELTDPPAANCQPAVKDAAVVSDDKPEG